MDRFQELDEDASYRSLREYARVSAFLPVRVRPVLEKERQGLRSRIVIESAMTEHPEMPEIENEALSACLHILNSKLDSIIRLLAFPSNKDREVDFARVNISAGGLSTSSSQLYALDDLVEARLILPTAPFMIFYVYGKVVKCDAVCEKFELCIEFTEIDDDIREEIVKYVFHKQREIMRKHRNSAL
ncbi:MAG: PilZ domain-containing protein [Syntrophobacteraceae bacterium]